ncbi:2,4'-dihydroxyacetophenone dioxygenase family protein [Aspergillus homomorphus CBS 101889]|uniref:ChrR-like cupin domain-containing protein n=1 Tax=Aspergillus homomorphus (strain CBS 101889) TaxID=1450537 RepID=A0A395HHF8_ASPHC|nr:hypothetical protein BO97DRAFT_401059 [Aspergillus homomorphus CBS 101889]RAL06929.1 hypothetical protein BO97DRAFT_401059 [Aspergillus homomorphus CBS 101889]
MADHVSVPSVKDDPETQFVALHTAPDVYINAKNDTCWLPWVGTIELKPYRFEARSGQFVVGLRSPVDACLGKHRHRGPVTAVTVAGSWRYKEYQWIAHPGDYVVENPGTIHTLYISGGSEVVFTINGSIEFFDDNDQLKQTMDIFSFAKLYYDHCEKVGIQPNPGLWY